MQGSLFKADMLHPYKSNWTTPETFPDLSSAKLIAVDVETYDPELKDKGPGSHRGAYVAGIAVGTDDGYRGYFPIRHELGGNLDVNTTVRWAKEQLGRANQPKIGANILYDMELLGTDGIELKGELIDVQYADPLIDENKLSYSLQSLSKHYLGEGKVTDELHKWELAAYKTSGSNIARCPVGLVGPYAEGDVDLPLRIWEKQKVILEQQGLMKLFKMECGLLPMLLGMRQRGVPVDVEKAQRLHSSLKKKVTGYQKMLNEKAGRSIDVNIATDLGKLFDKLNIPYPRTPKTKAPSIVKGWLESNRSLAPEMELILKIRKFQTIITTFLEGYILGKHVNGRIYGSFHPLRSDKGGTVSGRYCVAEDTEILINQNGKLKTVCIGEYHPTGKDLIQTHTGQWKRIIRRIYKGREVLYLYKCSNGANIKGTKNHRVLTPTGWKRLGELSIGEEITVDESFQSIHVKQRKHRKSSKRLYSQRQANNGRTCNQIRHILSQCSLYNQEQYEQGTKTVRTETSLFKKQIRKQKSNARKIWQKASQLQGRIGIWRYFSYIKARLVYWTTGIQTCGAVSDHLVSAFWNDRDSKRVRYSSHRWKSYKQCHQQFSIGLKERSCKASHSTEYITEINTLDEAPVWDIEVEKDHSYLSQGMFHHNSSSQPNLQNIPMRDKTVIEMDGVKWPLGKAIRSLFLPEEGCEWVKDDYSQVEFRILTHYGTGESAEAARYMYKNNPKTDFHTMCAEMCEIARDPAKNINFGLAYNMGEEKLAASLNRPIDEARALFQQYHERLPFVKNLQEETRNAASSRGYIKTILGRRARFDLWESRDWDTAKSEPALPYTQAKARDAGSGRPKGIRRAYTYKACNRLIQGSAADIMKAAMYKIWKSGVCDVVGVPHLTVHDELDWSIPKTKEAQQAHDEIINIMQTCVKLKVPLVCDTEKGTTWGEVE